MVQSISSIQPKGLGRNWVACGRDASTKRPRARHGRVPTRTSAVISDAYGALREGMGEAETRSFWTGLTGLTGLFRHTDLLAANAAHANAVRREQIRVF